MATSAGTRRCQLNHEQHAFDVKWPSRRHAGLGAPSARRAPLSERPMRTMRTHTLAALLVALAAPPSMAGTNAGSAVLGRWTVTGTAGAQETTSLSSDDVDKLLGTDFVVTAESVQFAGEKCDKPTFKQSRHNTTNFFWREFKFDPRSMRLPDPVTEIAIDCLLPSPITFIYVRDKRHIVFFWRGFFLDAKR